MILHEHEGKEWAAVVYECNTCTIKVAMIDPLEMLPKPTTEESSPSLKTDDGLTLEPPSRVAVRTPRPGDRPGNGTNQGIVWFPHPITTLASGVLFLRLAVHPDATMPFNHAAIFTSADRGKSWLPQTRGCSNADVAACSLPLAGSPADRFGPTLSWEMAVPQTCKAAALSSDGDRVLVASYQPHLLGDGTSIGWNGTELLISPQGAVSVATPVVPVAAHGLPHAVKEINYTGCPDCGQPTDPPGMQRRLAAANAYHGSPIQLKDGRLLTLLISVTYDKACATKRCTSIVTIVSDDCGRDWKYFSTVTSDGNEGSIMRLSDGRLFSVWRHNFDSTAVGLGLAYGQAFSSNDGKDWQQGGQMSAAPGSVPPHSVMPTLKALPGGGALLSGGRGGMYLWRCESPACVDKGLWVSTNVAAQHNALVSPADPFGGFPEACTNESAWRQLNSCPSKEYLGLALLDQADDDSATDTEFVVCYGHCGKVSGSVMPSSWCLEHSTQYTSHEIWCARGHVAGK